MATGPRPNNTGAIQTRIRGLREAKRAFQALPEITRTQMLGATEVTARAIASRAQGNLRSNPSVQTRHLHDAITWSLTKTSGVARVGVSTGQTVISLLSTRKRVRIKGIVISSGGASGRVDRPSRRAHFVEFGTRNMPAEPFMLPAAEAEQLPYLERVRVAFGTVEREVAAIGLSAPE